MKFLLFETRFLGNQNQRDIGVGTLYLASEDCHSSRLFFFVFFRAIFTFFSPFFFSKSIFLFPVSSFLLSGRKIRSESLNSLKSQSEREGIPLLRVFTFFLLFFETYFFFDFLGGQRESRRFSML